MSQGQTRATGRTDAWLGAHYRTISFAAGILASAAWVWTRDDALFVPALTLVVLSLVGDRLLEAPGFKLARGERAYRAVADWPRRQVITGAGGVAIGSESAGTGTVTPAAAEDTLGPITESVTATVTRSPQSTVDHAADAIRRASTPEELAESVAEYVSLRTVPGLRALSPERIRLEQDLFGAILEMQNLRAKGARSQDSGQLAQALARVELFWTRPEELLDEDVRNLTALVREASANMLLPPVPYSFRALGIKATLTGEANPCRICEPLRGQLYDPDNWRAPRLPIEGCEQERGCTCRYT